MYKLLLIVFVSCAPLSRKECLEKDWFDQGKSEGLLGENHERRFDYYNGVCEGRHKVEISKRDFSKGYNYGATVWCAKYDFIHKKGWERVGEVDAQQGIPRSQYRTYQKKCGKVGIEVEKQAYLNGYRKGLKKFCTYQSGLDFGKIGDQYDKICVGKGEKEFLQGYKQGNLSFKERKLKQNSLSKQEKIHYLLGLLDNLESKKNENIALLESEIIDLNEEISDGQTEKNDLRFEIKALQKEIKKKGSLVSLEDRLSEKKKKYKNLKVTMRGLEKKINQKIFAKEQISLDFDNEMAIVKADLQKAKSSRAE